MLRLDSKRSLRVDALTLPTWYKTILSLPWFRVYTLNIDDLELAVQRQFDLPRAIISVSGTAPQQAPQGSLGKLEVIHLNGTLEDVPDEVTFSNSQYGERLSRQEPVYVQLTADREIVKGGKYTLVLVALRATKVEACLRGTTLQNIPLREFVMPPLADHDIDGLFESLENENRLGALRALLPEERKKQ